MAEDFAAEREWLIEGDPVPVVDELLTLRAQRDAALALCARVDAAWVGESRTTGTSMPLLRTAPLVSTGAVRAALGVQPEGSSDE